MMTARQFFSPSYRQIRSLLIVLLSAVLFAGLFAFWLVHRYSASTFFLLETILLDPNLVEGLSYEIKDPKTGKKERRLFDRMELLFFQEKTGEWKRQRLSLAAYRELYQKIAKDRSLLEPSEDLQNRFFQENPTMLTLVVRESIDTTFEKTKVFQEVQFLQRGDYYRVQLHGESQVPWAYFYHPGIHKQLEEP